MTSNNRNSTTTLQPIESSSSNDATGSPWRQRRIRAQHSGYSSRYISAIYVTAAFAMLSSLNFGHATQQTTNYKTNNHQQQRRHLYEPLNTTKIELSPLLSNRYRWLRQSPELIRLLDANANANDRTNNGHPKQRRRHLDGAYYDDAAYVNADDVNSNNADDAAAAAATDDAVVADDAAVADDAYVAADDAAAATDDYVAADAYICEDKTCTVNEQCTKFLFGFLEGTTDAKDNCEGIMNAYIAADCGTIKTGSKTDTTIYDLDDDFNDDYFGIFYDHQCCSSLRSHYYEYCDETEWLNGYNLLVVAAVMLLCECAKSIVKKNHIRWLPEAAACMLVGVAVALGAGLLGENIENIGFDEEIFMYLLLPPIIFEAALSVNKREFRRRRGAIMVFALLGTLFSSFLTGAATYYSAKYFGDESLSILDSLVFGSLISSIDPVAILSVLTSLKMSETDTIYILVFGESLLNDGIAITLFKSLVQQYDSKDAISMDDILGSIADFLIIAFGSCIIGLACGIACLCYFHLNSSILHPVMEVASFFLWAVIPYWMAEAFGWSGIVAIVIMGFFMDMYLRPGWDPAELELEEERRLLMIASTNGQKMTLGGNRLNTGLEYYNWDDDDQDGRFRFRGTAVDIPRPHSAPPPPPDVIVDRERSESSRTSKAHNLAEKDGDADTIAGTSMTTNPNIKAILMKREFVRMSREADEHVRFVAHILSSMSENAIFAYLGLFLFSSNYEWDAILCAIGVTSCILSRALMVVVASWFIWHMHVCRQRAGCHSGRGVDTSLDDSKSSKIFKDGVDSIGEENDGASESVDPLNTPISKSARALSNYKVQVVLILAGLRGAVSLALVESVPIYNGVTGVGSKNKPLLKAMTSSAIIFTIFVLGGGAYYILKWLDITSDDMLIKSTGQSNNRVGGYLYPPLVCGGNGYVPPETELPYAGSWRSNPRSPRFGHPSSSPVGTFVPPSQSSPSRLIARSRSDWSHDSYYAAGLNDIGVNDRQMSRDSVDVIKNSRSKSSDGPQFPREIV
mmetsp:Transcript_20938/g.45398  ORF Transcript_20938/g.45398 Transcript_20938/m.45398 type:complete len:1026 (-) Transcript_20938:62-3139(-)|eukprot:CAMPEP_0172303812 /NCGR_PEP_ID=MMETSP1058-20130122/5326_1 /TAXON_ID=83371 /ORGANISM="Detonula confervacea, Strain CCMP 353" /LENGTH=1025 /DNA_ID=CAMNT_0013014809 /DNA_START=154 /DNA_END=3231 /DNA_ORIENTATION=+